MGNIKKAAIVDLLFERGYDSDPIKKWKKTYNLKTANSTVNEKSSDEEDEVEEDKDCNYIMNMPIWSLTRERYLDLIKQAGQKESDLKELKSKEIHDLWRENLDEFLEELEKVEAKEREDEMASIQHGVQGGGSGKKSRGKKKGGNKLVLKEETFPSVDGEYCEVEIDEAIKKRLELNKKVKKEPKTEVKSKIKEEPQDPDKPTSLADKLKKKKNIIVKKEPSLSNGSTDKKTMKQTTINFKKKTSGKNPWESDSDDNSFSNSETQEDSPIVPKRTVTSRNKTTKKYTIESSEDENENFSSSEDEGDFKSAKIDSPQMPRKKPVSKTQMTKVVPLKKGPVKRKKKGRGPLCQNQQKKSHQRKNPRLILVQVKRKPRYQMILAELILVHLLRGLPPVVHALQLRSKNTLSVIVTAIFNIVVIFDFTVLRYSTARLD